MEVHVSDNEFENKAQQMLEDYDAFRFELY